MRAIGIGKMGKRILCSIIFSAVLTLMVLNIPALIVHGEQEMVKVVF
jgi:hypothetical protein